ncbi:methyltransferase domain-containing protein [Streptomyces morookaense]|uniref:Protein-L-isoaspartate O-methyltransferase n=1 Tax=Streptomyces morookaense TaxID=1970 RepID=A0A7Y7AZU3_STRMO|nr:methyltransferase domain-containing protein [Streptomyces morookaense]NVK76399.1 methyltransferase domain-containing protein [Streptomyces morookaense]GHF06750.1 protein-L-isoaspartate O-methyltransferase [Streptomyces morookaense]
MNWQHHAEALAEAATHGSSRWRAPVAETPRHLFIPRWWQRDGDAYALRIPQNDDEWLTAAYADTSLITRVGPLHADLATPDDRPRGRPTSSATLPSLVVTMHRHACLDPDDMLLYVGTGSGYGTALASRYLAHPDRVTSVDVDPYLVEAARDRLGEIGLCPRVETVDATGSLPVRPGSVDRIVSMVSVRTIPPSWLEALCPGGRLVTTIAGTSLLVTAERDPDGGATGRVLWDRAGFMTARHGDDYPPGLDTLLAAAEHQDGEDVTTGPYPVVDVEQAWDLDSMLSVTTPGIVHRYHQDGENRTAIMAHADGSWARATAVGIDRPTVHQGGPRRLWDALDEVRAYWLNHGELPVRGARVLVNAEGRTILARGGWHTKL